MNLNPTEYLDFERPAVQMLRTYGRASKRKYTSMESPGEADSVFGANLRTSRDTGGISSNGNISSPAKRRKLSIATKDLAESNSSKGGKQLRGQKTDHLATPTTPAKSSTRTTSSMSIFDDIPSAPATPRPKLAKRMLSRSKTESSLDSSSSSSLVISTRETSASPPKAKPLSKVKSHSIPSLPPSPRHRTTAPPAIPSSAPVPSVKRGYAGTSRSYLVVAPKASTSTLPALPIYGSKPLPDGGSDVEDDEDESYTSLRTRWGVDASEDDPYVYAPSPPANSTPLGRNSPTKKGKTRDEGVPVALSLPPGMMNDVRSITELRSKGESRRFLDEVGYLLEGMDVDGGIGLRRASALDILTKLTDAEFARKAKTADLLGRTWDLLLHTSGDRILNAILLAFAALVSRDPGALVEFAVRPTTNASPSIMSTIQSLSPAPTGPGSIDILVLISNDATGEDKLATDAALKAAGVGRVEKGIVKSLHALIDRHILPGANTQISLPLLISHTLAQLPPDLLHPLNHLDPLLDTLKHALTEVEEMLEAYRRGASIPWSRINAEAKSAGKRRGQKTETSAIGRAPPLLHVVNCLALLDTYLLGQWSDDGDDEDDEEDDDAPGSIMLKLDIELMKGLIALCVLSEVILKQNALEAVSTLADTAHRATELALRILISVSHDSGPWCRALLSDTEYAYSFVLRTVLLTPPNNSREERKVDDAARLRNRVDGSENVKTRSQVEDLVDTDVDDDDDVEDQRYLQTLDRMYLALGLLTNLVQVEDSAKDICRQTLLSPNCTLKRTCLPNCSCTTSTSALALLGRLYTSSDTDHKRELSPHTTPTPSPKTTETTLDIQAEFEAASRAFFAGHLAILLGLLMQGSPRNQAMLLPSTIRSSSERPAPSSSSDGDSPKIELRALVSRAQEFLEMYARLGALTKEQVVNAAKKKRLCGSSGAEEGMDLDTVESPVDVGVVTSRRTDRGEDVARQVVAFLEGLTEVTQSY